MAAVCNKAGKTAGAVFAAVIVAVSAQPAAAQTVVSAYYRDPTLPTYNYPGPASAVLSVPVKASVGGSCGFQTAPNATRFVGNIDTNGWSETVSFVPECTAPWRIAVSSQNGGLKTGAVPLAGYSNKAPYTVALNVNADGGPVAANCSVALIDQAAGATACSFEGAASTSNGLLVPRSFGLAASTIQMSAPAFNTTSTDILVSGSYSDVLIVTISPAS